MHSSTPYLSRQQRRASTRLDCVSPNVRALKKQVYGIPGRASDNSSLPRLVDREFAPYARHSLRHRHRVGRIRGSGRLPRCHRHPALVRPHFAARTLSPAPGFSPHAEPRQRRLGSWDKPPSATDAHDHSLTAPCRRARQPPANTTPRAAATALPNASHCRRRFHGRSAGSRCRSHREIRR